MTKREEGSVRPKERETSATKRERARRSQGGNEGGAERDGTGCGRSKNIRGIFENLLSLSEYSTDAFKFSNVLKLPAYGSPCSRGNIFCVGPRVETCVVAVKAGITW